MKTVVIRTLTGSVFVSLIIGSALWHPLAFMMLFLIFAVWAATEFFLMCKSEDLRPSVIPGIITAALAYLSAGFYFSGSAGAEILLVIIVPIAIIFIAELYRTSEKPFSNIAITLLPAYYIGIPLASLLFIFNPFGNSCSYFPNLVMGFFIIIWTSDTAAYLSGMAFGRHKLFPRISPGKSWEGSAGGFIAGLAAAGVVSIFFRELSLWHWLGLAAVIMVFSTFGDLAESMLKRSFGKKDSGHLLPGHGGMLDRLDGVLFAAPAAAVYLYLIKLFCS